MKSFLIIVISTMLLGSVVCPYEKGSPEANFETQFKTYQGTDENKMAFACWEGESCKGNVSYEDVNVLNHAVQSALCLLCPNGDIKLVAFSDEKYFLLNENNALSSNVKAIP